MALHVILKLSQVLLGPLEGLEQLDLLDHQDLLGGQVPLDREVHLVLVEILETLVHLVKLVLQVSPLPVYWHKLQLFIFFASLIPRS